MAVTFPNSPTTGQTYTYLNTVFTWDGKRWVRYNNATVNVTVADTAPVSPASGNLWFNSSTLNSYVYYNDGDSSQWVSIGVTSAAAALSAANILPSQTGNSGKALITNGSTLSWGTSIGGYTGSAGSSGYTGSTGLGYTGSGGGTTSVLTIGTGLSGTSFNGSAPVTIAINSTVTTNSGTQTLTNKTITDLASTSTINDGDVTSYAIGFKAIPQSATSTGNLVLSDAGKHVYVSTGVTVPPSSTAAFDIGAVITIINSSSSVITITQGSGVTMRQANTTYTGDRSLAAYGICSVIKVATNTWYISGNGVS
jgi:hypothetical protein